MTLQRSNEYRFLAAGDLALSINKGDWTWLGIWAITPDRDLILVDAIRKQQSPEQTVTKLYELHDTYQPTAWLFDDDNATKVFQRLVYEHARANNLSPPPLELMPTRGRDKETRAAAIRGYWRSGRISIVNDPRFALDAVSEVLCFPSEPDDFVDMAGLIGRKMVQMDGIETKEPMKNKPLESAIVMKDGQPHFNIGLATLFEQRERGLAKHNRLRIQ